MKVGIVITLYNRSELTRQMFASLKETYVYDDINIYLIDDCSTEAEAVQAFENFTWYEATVYKFRNTFNRGIKFCLLEGCDLAFANGCDVVTILDNDTIMKPDWLERLLKLHGMFKTSIVTGFHSITRNRDGSERHPIIKSYFDYCFKSSVGGINMLFNEKKYRECIWSVLNNPVGNWDAEACKLSTNPIVCTLPSVIQHTGTYNSTLNHNAESPDIACGFNYIDMSNVTLIGVDCNHFHELEIAASVSMTDINFGAVRLLTSAETTNPHAEKIQPLTSKEAYNRFIMKELYKYVSTQYMLIIQGDGYVLDASQWDPNWLLYDYIGATWLYKDRMNVGNGGFSLRSKRLMQILATDPNIVETYPEDHQICRTYRKYLEEVHYIKFAPEGVANLFSIEAYGCAALAGANKYSGQFGFHGWLVDFTDSNLPHIPPKPPVKKRRRGITFNI